MAVKREKIIKSSGEEEEFSYAKLKRSVELAGADETLAQEILELIEAEEPTLKTTEEIHQKVFHQLQNKNLPVADRYNLKRSIMNLGPSGFPFEKFLGEIFREEGYKVINNQMISGKCVRHEVDLILERDGVRSIVEVKFHNKPGLKSDLKVPLYVKSRFEDVKYQTLPSGKRKLHFHEAWIITNTKFSVDAIKYANCEDLRLISWDYPSGKSLAEMVNRLGLYPITAISLLSKEQQLLLIEKNIVLCRQVASNSHELHALGLQDDTIKKVIEEAQAINTLKNTLY